MSDTQPCKDCGQEKPFDQFFRSNSKTGYMSVCRECCLAKKRETARQSAIQAEERAQKREQTKALREAIKQRAYQRIADDTLPTQEDQVHWIYADREIEGYPDDTDRSGKWLIWLSPETIDRYWVKIRDAVRAGKLGDQAKVSTHRALSEQRPRYVICVYSYDYNDVADVMRIREELRKLGIQREIIYKSNEDTRNMLYGSNYTPKHRA